MVESFRGRRADRSSRTQGTWFRPGLRLHARHRRLVRRAELNCDSPVAHDAKLRLHILVGGGGDDQDISRMQVYAEQRTWRMRRGGRGGRVSLSLASVAASRNVPSNRTTPLQFNRAACFRPIHSPRCVCRQRPRLPLPFFPLAHTSSPISAEGTAVPRSDALHSAQGASAAHVVKLTRTLRLRDVARLPAMRGTLRFIYTYFQAEDLSQNGNEKRKYARSYIQITHGDFVPLRSRGLPLGATRLVLLYDFAPQKPGIGQA